MPKELGHCLYCLDARATNIDHLISKNQARRRPNAKRERDNPRFKVPSCHPCNVAKGTRYRVPVTHQGLIAELERITGNVYATFDGSAEDLRAVVR